MNQQIKPFDLAAAKRGAKVVLRDHPDQVVTQLHEFKGVYLPIAGVVGSKAATVGFDSSLALRHEDGRTLQHEDWGSDFVMLVEEKKVYPLIILAKPNLNPVQRKYFRTEEERLFFRLPLNTIGLYLDPISYTE